MQHTYRTCDICGVVLELTNGKQKKRFDLKRRVRSEVRLQKTAEDKKE
jgi:hypothetical protein